MSRPVHLLVRKPRPVPFGATYGDMFASAGQVKCHDRFVWPGGVTRYTDDPAAVTCPECRKGLPLAPRRTSCACGCGRWWYEPREAHRPRAYASDECRLRARNERRRSA